MGNPIVGSKEFNLFDQGDGVYGTSPGGGGTFFDTLTYVGAARIPKGKQGGTELIGRRKVYMIYDAAENSLFISAGNSAAVSPKAPGDTPFLGEWNIPTLVNSTTYSELNVATLAQDYSDMLDAGTTGNPESLDRITGGYVSGNKIVLNANDWYDAAADNVNTTLVIEDKTDLAGSTVKGYYDGDFEAYGAGWTTDIPAGMQAALGGDVIFGYASNDSIVNRFSNGPTAYAVTLADVTGHAGSSGTFSSETLMSFPHPLVMGDVDPTLSNSVWTKISAARCGFIIPGTTKYAVVGKSGGHEFAMEYKGTNDAGEKGSGWITLIKADNYNYYWVFDTDDLAAVKAGSMDAEDVFPTERGELPLPFQEITDPTFVPDGFSIMHGAAYDPVTSRLYMLLDRDNDSDRVLLVYTVGT